MQTEESDLTVTDSDELNHSCRETSTQEEFDEDLVLGTRQKVKENEQQREVATTEPIQELQLPEPVVLTSYRLLLDENVVEEMEVDPDPNILVVPPELTSDAILNFQLIHKSDKAVNSRNEGLMIEDEPEL